MKQIAFTVLFLLTSFALHAQQEASEVSPDYRVTLNQVAPDFSLTFPSGETLRLSDMKGKVVMLQFTASWCGVCRKEMPHIEKRIWQRHKDNENFVLWGIDLDEPADKVQAFAEAVGTTYPIGLDPKGGIFYTYAQEKAGITRNVIIGKDGKIVMLTRLYKEDEFERMVQLIDRLLEE